MIRISVGYLHLKGFLNNECKLYLSSFTLPQCKTIFAYRTSNDVDLPMKFDGDGLSLSLEEKDYATFALIM
jgi:hypothetical protein